MIKTEELLPEDSPENPELHGMSGQSEGSFQSPDEEAACESPYGSVSPPRDLPGTSLGDPSEYVADFNEIQRVIVHHGSCTGEGWGEGSEGKLGRNPPPGSVLSIIQRGTRPAGIPFGKSLSRKLLSGQEREQSQGLQRLGRRWVWGGDIGVTAWGTRMLFSRDRATLLHVHGVSKRTTLGRGSCWGGGLQGEGTWPRVWGPVLIFGDVSPCLGTCP